VALNSSPEPAPGALDKETAAPVPEPPAKTGAGKGRWMGFGFWGAAALLLIAAWQASPSSAQIRSCELRTPWTDRYKCSELSLNQKFFLSFGVAAIIAGFSSWPRKRRDKQPQPGRQDG
jgi:hypothetical protein